MLKDTGSDNIIIDFEDDEDLEQTPFVSKVDEIISSTYADSSFILDDEDDEDLDEEPLTDEFVNNDLSFIYDDEDEDVPDVALLGEGDDSTEPSNTKLSKTSKMSPAEIKKKETQTAVKSALVFATAMRNSFTSVEYGNLRSCNSLTEAQKKRRLERQLRDESPSYVTDTIAAKIRKELSQVKVEDLNIALARAMLNDPKYGFSPESRSLMHAQDFLNYLLKTKHLIDNEVKSEKNLHEQINSKGLSFYEELFADQNGANNGYTIIVPPSDNPTASSISPNYNSLGIHPTNLIGAVEPNEVMTGNDIITDSDEDEDIVDGVVDIDFSEEEVVTDEPVALTNFQQSSKNNDDSYKEHTNGVHINLLKHVTIDYTYFTPDDVEITPEELEKVRLGVSDKYRVEDLKKKKCFIFDCGTCGAKDIKSYCLPVSFLVRHVPSGTQIDEVIAPPYVCPNCGAMHPFDVKLINKIKSAVKSKVENLPSLGKVLSIDNVIVYYPSYQDLISVAPDVFTVNQVSMNSIQERNIDFDSYKKEFLINENLYHSMASITDDTLGLHNLVKILANQSDDYEDIKEKALASLIQFIKLSPLEIVSESSYYYKMMPYYYKDNYVKFKDAIAYNIDTRCDLRKGIDYKILKEDYDKYCEFAKDFNKERDTIIKSMRDCGEFFSNVTISNVRLTDEDKSDYLSYEPLKECLEYISDLMIVASLGENYLNFFKPRKMGGSSPIRDASYDTRFRVLRDVRTLDKMPDNLANYVEFFNDRLSANNSMVNHNHLNVRDFFLLYTSDYNFVVDVSSLAKSLYKGDYFDAYHKKCQVIGDYKSVLDKLLTNNSVYSKIGEFVYSVPDIENPNCSKFEYYFNEPTFTDDQKNKILELFNLKSVVPKVLEGNTFEEKYEYYKNLDTTHLVDFIHNEKFEKYVKDNLALILSISCMDNSMNYQDFILYNLGRDFFISLSNLSLDDVANSLYLNKDICSVYLEDSFDYNVQNYDLSNQIRNVIFSIDSINQVLNDEDLDKKGLLSSLSSEESVMLEDLKGLKIPTQIVEAFFASER